MLFFLLFALARHRAVEHPTSVPNVKRIFVVVLENTDADLAERLPFISRLAARGALLRNHRCIGHPSQPNYIALAAGSTLGVTGSEPATIDAMHLGDLVEAKGLSWKIYAENYPGGCFLGETFGNIGEGQYVRRHVPFLAFVNVQRNFDRCLARVVGAQVFDADLSSGALPNLAFYIPQNLHNGHDSNPFFADAWLESRFGPLLDDPRFTDNTLFIVTYDESASDNLRVHTVLIGPMVRPGAVSTDPYDHYDLLRTIEIALRLGTLGRLDATARPVVGVWRAP